MPRPLATLTLALLSLAVTAAAAPRAPSLLGPPWISIEYPANPFDRLHRDAFLYVHTFHHADAAEASVSASAEGIVAGARRSVALELRKSSRPGTYSLRRQWPAEGTWMLVVRMRAGGGGNGATALVDIGPAGDVTAVRVPSTTRDGWVVPTAVTQRQVEEALRARVRAEVVRRS